MLRINTVAKLSGLLIDEVSNISLTTNRFSLFPKWFLYGCFTVGFHFMGGLFTARKASPATDLERLHKCSLRNFPVLSTPQTSSFSACSWILTSHNKPCDVVVYTSCRKTAGLKFFLRCEYCKINYNYDCYGNKSAGWCLYQTSRPYVEATDVCFVDCSLLEFQCALAKAQCFLANSCLHDKRAKLNYYKPKMPKEWIQSWFLSMYNFDLTLQKPQLGELFWVCNCIQWNI